MQLFCRIWPQVGMAAFRWSAMLRRHYARNCTAHGRQEIAQKALEIHQQLMPLHRALFCEASPGPVKYAASLLGLCSAFARLPLVEIADSSKQQVEDALRFAKLL